MLSCRAKSNQLTKSENVAVLASLWDAVNFVRSGDWVEKMNPSFRKSSFDLCPERGSRKKVGHLQRKMVDKSDYSESPITALSIRLAKALSLGSLESR